MSKDNKQASEFKRGDIYLADLSRADSSGCRGSEQNGFRPVLLIHDDVGNEKSSVIIGTVLTSREKVDLPTHVYLDAKKYGLKYDSTVLCEQIKTLDKVRMGRCVSHLDDKKMVEVDAAISRRLGLCK